MPETQRKVQQIHNDDPVNSLSTSGPCHANATKPSFPTKHHNGFSGMQINSNLEAQLETIKSRSSRSTVETPLSPIPTNLATRMSADDYNIPLPKVTSLDEMSWAGWKGDLCSHLDVKKLSAHLDPNYAHPLFTPQQCIQLGISNTSYMASQVTYDNERRACNGAIYRSLPDSVRHDFLDAYERSDPVAFMAELSTRFGGTRPGMRYNMFEQQLSLRKLPGETLTQLYDHNLKLSRKRKRLHDPHATVQMQDEEIDVYCLMSAIVDEHESVVSAIHASIGQNGTISLASVKGMFQSEDDLLRNKSVKMESANYGKDKQKPKMSLADGLKRLHADCGLTECLFCKAMGHPTDKCWKITQIVKGWEGERKEYSKNRIEKRNKPKNNAHAATDVSAGTATIESTSVCHHVSATMTSLANLASRSSALTDGWNTDTSCSTSMTCRREYFRNYRSLRVPITLANGHVVYSASVGTVEFVPLLDGVECPSVLLQHVLHVPDLSVNLFSVYHTMTKHAYEFRGKGRQVIFIKNDKTLFTATVNNQNVGYLDGCTICHDTAFSATTAPKTLELWHRRLAHVNYEAIMKMQRNAATKGLSFSEKKVPSVCEPCVGGKLHRHAVPRGPARREVEVLACIHADLKGPLPNGVQGYRYWVVFIDNATRFRKEYFLRSKDKLTQAFKDYVAYAESQHAGKRVKVFHNDKGGEFISGELLGWMTARGMVSKHTERKEVYQNGVAERAHRDSKEAVTAMLIAAKMPVWMWPLAMSAYTHTRNCIETAALPDGVTPFARWFGRKPDLLKFRVWGCTTYTLVPVDKRSVFDSHYVKTVFAGYSSTKPGCWMFYEPGKHTFIELSQAVFDENTMPGLGGGTVCLDSLPEVIA